MVHDLVRQIFELSYTSSTTRPIYQNLSQPRCSYNHIFTCLVIVLIVIVTRKCPLRSCRRNNHPLSHRALRLVLTVSQLYLLILCTSLIKITMFFSLQVVVLLTQAVPRTLEIRQLLHSTSSIRPISRKRSISLRHMLIILMTSTSKRTPPVSDCHDFLGR